MMQRRIVRLCGLRRLDMLLWKESRRFSAVSSVRDVLAKAHGSRRIINVDTISQKEFKFLPEELKNLICLFYGVGINQRQLLENSGNKYFIEINGDGNALNESEIFIKHCMSNGFIYRPQPRYNLSQSVVDIISFRTGCLLHKIANHKYLCLPNMDLDNHKHKDINIVIANMECKSILNLKYAAKDIDIIFHTFCNKIERLKWEYSFCIWVDNISQNKQKTDCVDVSIGYYDIKHEIESKERQQSLLQLHEEILSFFKQNQFEVVALSSHCLEIFQVKLKWFEFWKNIRFESELVTLSMYENNAIFQTNKEFGTLSIQKCKEWLLNLIADNEEISDEFIMNKFEERDRKIVDEMETDGKAKEVKYEYDEQLFKECTSPILSKSEFENYVSNIGGINIRRIRSVGKIMERTLNGYGVSTVMDLYQNKQHLGITHIKGINKVIQYVEKLIE